jgi:hypothetical protein
MIVTLMTTTTPSLMPLMFVMPPQPQHQAGIHQMIVSMSI